MPAEIHSSSNICLHYTFLAGCWILQQKIGLNT